MPEPGGTYRPAVVWRSLALRLALAVVPLWFTTAVVVFSTPWRLKLTVGGMLALSIASPATGLVALALVAPLANLIAIAAGFGSFRLAEAFTLAFLSGWLLRAPEDRPGPRAAARFGWLFAAAIVASMATQTWQLGQSQPYRGELKDTFELLFYSYYFIADRAGFVAGAHVLEGIALVAAAVALVRQHPRLASTLPAALAASASLAAASSALLLYGIAPAAALERYRQIGYRVSAHVADVNAAGSYFAMALCLAAGVAQRVRWRSAFWIASVALCGWGLWISRSRSAIMAAAIALAVTLGWSLTARLGRSARWAVVGVLLAAALAGSAVRADLFGRRAGVFGADIRKQFNETSLRMLETRPLTGVGVGQYYRYSSLFLPANLSWAYGHENAHNYFFQIAAEIGLLGFAMFAGWIGTGIVRATRALWRVHGDARLLGIASGIGAFLATSLVGHPLLVDEVAIPFWIAFGLMTALAGSTLRDAAPTETVAKADPPTPQAQLVTAVAAGLLIAMATPVGAARTAVAPRASAAVEGFYEWETAEDGTRFRWTSDYGSLFVPAAVTRVFIPVRMPANIPALTPLGVEVMTMGVPAGRSFIGTSWADLNIKLPDVEPPTHYKRIDLRIDRTWQPAVYLPGSTDMRSVGLQVGEIKLLREY